MSKQLVRTAHIRSQITPVGGGMLSWWAGRAAFGPAGSREFSYFSSKGAREWDPGLGSDTLRSPERSVAPSPAPQ